jgi:2-hydroxy-6-oxonona-2,4-dienedioate hydrolase/4,5:9,10-diseco-3-hydroxy-5,9,17-trioxoandrosta-1(10),2-diene-4-oate hydrolase
VALTAQETSKFVQAGDVRVHYHEAGSGPTVVCIHGGAPGAYGWGNFGRNMDALAGHFRTLIVDLPGYGKSDKPAVTGGRYGFYARVFRDMFDALGIEKAHVVGLATGGAAAIKMAIDYPERIDRLVLCSSAGGLALFQPSPSEGQKVISQYYAPPGPSREKMRAYLEMIMYDHSQITDEFVEERYQASIDPEFMASAPEGRPSATVNTEPVWKDLDKIRQKTMVIWGRDNRVQGYDNALFMLQRIPDVQLLIFGKCGLWVPVERADEFNRYVIDFLTAA